jgi:hypothetical protein
LIEETAERHNNTDARVRRAKERNKRKIQKENERDESAQNKRKVDGWLEGLVGLVGWTEKAKR